MKNVILPVFLLFSFLSHSQSSKDFVNANNEWNQVGFNFMGEGTTFGFSFTEDSTEVDGLWYRELLRSKEEAGGNWINSGQFLRQSGRQVYKIIFGGDVLIYDFSLMVGDTFSVDTGNQLLIVSEVDSITLEDNSKRKRILLSCESLPEFQHTWIEGIGDIRGPLMVEFSCALDVNTSLLCFSSNEVLLYSNESFDECWVSTFTKERSILNLELHPNPTHDIINITGYQGNIQYSIFSNTGVELRQGWTNSQNIELSGLPSGLYIIKVNIDDGRQVFRVIKN